MAHTRMSCAFLAARSNAPDKAMEEAASSGREFGRVVLNSGDRPRVLTCNPAVGSRQ